MLMQTTWMVANAEGGTIVLPSVHSNVIVDGVLYKPGEFNRLNQGLYQRGIYLHYLSNPQDGTLYAFTKVEDFKAKQTEFAPITHQPRQITLVTQDGVFVFYSDEEAKAFIRKREQAAAGNVTLASANYTSFYEHANYAGYEVRHPNNVKCANLSNTDNCSVSKSGGGTNWNDRISSVVASSGSSIWTYMFEHINYQGALLAFESNRADPNLWDDGFDNRISSTCVGTASYCFP